jgi:hypothetical protein
MSVATSSTMALADIRPYVVSLLAPVADTDPNVLAGIADSVTPPALMVGWDDPWIQPNVPGGLRTMGPCIYQARLRVVCVANRLDPESGHEALEGLVTYVVGRMGAGWGLERVSEPLQTDMSGVSSLIASVYYNVPTSI